MNTKHSLQKALSLVAFLMLLVATTAQAKRVVERPYFLGSNNHKLEIERVTLDKKATIIDVKIYQASGDVGIDSHASIMANGVKYDYIGSKQLPKGVFVKVPECGYVAATLRFKPMPESTTEFDFRETADNSGWNIYGVRLDGKRPHADIPQHLLQQAPDKNSKLPSTDLNLGKTVVAVRLLGYKPEYKTTLDIIADNWFSPYRMPYEHDSISVDGTCQVSANAILPTVATIRVNRTEIPFLAVPNDTTTVTIDLPTLTLAATHLFATDSDVKKYVWFEGKHAAVDTELQSVKTKIDVLGVTSFDDICGMTPLQYRDYVQQSYERLLAAINSNAAIGTATRTLAQSILSMNYASALFGFKNNISMAPMIAGKRGVPRADMSIDTVSYFKPLEKLSVLHSKNQRYYYYLSDFTSALRRKYISADPLLDDIAVGKRLSRSFNRKRPLTEQQMAAAHDSIANDMVRELLFANNEDLKSQLASADNILAEVKKSANQNSTFSIIDIDPKMSAEQILPTIINKYKGKRLLIDFWNTWCMPCRAAMSTIRPLKEQLTDVVYVYIADASSPVDKWGKMIKTISGVHVRLTEEQADALAKIYKFSGIPTYFVVNKEGKITYQKTSFPGVEKLKEELNASNSDSAVVADVADSEYTDISKLRITPIGRYRSYYTMFYRVSGATTTGNMAYTLTMKDSVANCDESSFCYTMANLHGPNSSYGNRFEVYKKNAEGWGRMPFKGGFTDLGYELLTGKSAEMEFSSNKFATPLKMVLTNYARKCISI